MINKSFFKKNKGSLIAVLIIALLFIPQTGMPIKVLLHKLISFSPSEISEEKRETINNYHWELISLEGRSANLAHSKGKVVVINFWATWCPPCVAEMPSLQSLYNEFGDRVDFYFVSDEQQEKLKNFMTKKEYDFPVYLQRFAEPNAIKTTALPTTYIIDKDGEIVVQKTGAANWDSKAVKTLLEKLLKG